MRHGDIDFPDEVMKALRDNRLVIFAGAGVSVGSPANLPSFEELAELVSSGTGKSSTEPLDRFLGELEHQGTNVKGRVAEILSCGDSEQNPLHQSLLRLSVQPNHTRIITTNFDLLFEKAVESIWGSSIGVYRAPALPVGSRFHGIVHVHGALSDAGEMVLTDRDFGRAYLTEGWARRFLLDVFQNFTVLFVGYSHDDVVMSYLSRALPFSEEKTRFALVKEDENTEKWDLLGIQPITFPAAEGNPYQSLETSIQKLADYVNFSVLERKQRIKDIAESSPLPLVPEHQENIDFLNEALTNEGYTHFFTRAATDAAWLDWLDNQGHLQALFENGELTPSQIRLAQWISETFVSISCPELFLLIGKYQVQFNHKFWVCLVNQVSLSESISKDNFNRWASILLKVAPSRLVAFHLDEIAKKSHELQLPKIALKVFQLMSENHIFLSKPFLSNDNEPMHPNVDVRLLSDHWNIENIWEQYLQPNISVLADDVLKLIINVFEERYDTRDAWKHDEHVFDSDSYRRAAIKPHEQDKYPSAIDVLINAARTTIDYKLQNQSDSIVYLKQLIHKQPFILQRLAIYSVIECSRLTPTEKANWVLENTNLHESFIKHEIFTLIKLVYPSLDVGMRQRVIDEILSFKWFEQNDESETHEAYHCFEWFRYLYDSCEDCAILKRELNKLEKKYPEFKESEYPDLSHWSSNAEWTGHQSPWSVEDLLASNKGISYEKIISFEAQGGFHGPDRNGLLITIIEAAKQDTNWSFRFAEFLSDKELWNQDAWKSLFSAWEECSEEHIEDVFSWLEKQSLHKHFCGNIADLLQKMFQSKTEFLTESLVHRSNNIALNLWTIATSEKEASLRGDWVIRAINHPAGKLSLFWVESLSIWNKLHSDNVIPDNYKENLKTMVEEGTVAGGYARTIFCSQFSFLFTRDDAWVHENITPFFMDDDIEKFEQAWSGFLTWGRLYPSVITELSEAFLGAAKRLEKDIPESEQGRFIEFYVSCLSYVENVKEDWIPELLNNITENNKEKFANQIRYLLQGLDEAMFKKIWRNWLKDYWRKRIAGVPCALEREEINVMIEWAVHTKDLFPEAVKLIEQMPIGDLGHSSAVYMLKNSPLVSEYSNAMAEFLIYLLKSRVFSYHGIERVLPRLVNKITDSDIKNSLIEQLEIKGIDTSSVIF